MALLNFIDGLFKGDKAKPKHPCKIQPCHRSDTMRIHRALR